MPPRQIIPSGRGPTARINYTLHQNDPTHRLIMRDLTAVKPLPDEQREQLEEICAVSLSEVKAALSDLATEFRVAAAAAGDKDGRRSRLDMATNECRAKAEASIKGQREAAERIIQTLPVGSCDAGVDYWVMLSELSVDFINNALEANCLAIIEALEVANKASIIDESV